jgi:phospholipid-binding lipoprotein MlaA
LGTSTTKIGRISPALAIAIAAAVSGCASSGMLGDQQPQHLAARPETAAEPQENTDPYEKTNRVMLEGNQTLNHDIIYPVANAYRDTLPEPVRQGISNFTANLSEPTTFANQILQLRIKSAVGTAGRFLMNSTVGLGGVFDVASQANLPHQSGDFGQTLYVWGLRDSEYVVLPFLGPTNARDAVGNGVEFAATWFAAPSVIPTKFASTVNNVNNLGTMLTPFSSLSKVDDLQELEKSSMDFYAMLRSVVEQRRQAELDEALRTSALTSMDPGGPVEADPVMTFQAPANFLENPKRLAKADAPQVIDSEVVGPKIIGAPAPAKPVTGKVIIGPIEAQ